MQAVLKALSWTLLHSLWQGLLAALLAAIIISMTKKATALLRYNLLGVVLISFIAATIITYAGQLRQHQQVSAFTSTATITIRDNAMNKVADNTTSSTLSSSFTDNLSHWFNHNADWLMLTWALFFLLNCVKLITGLASVHRLRHYKVHPASAEWTTKLMQLQDTLGMRQTINLLQSELVKVPVALGMLRPLILLPVGLLAHIPPEQVEAILLHELAHIRRKDYLVNFLQRFADAIFFFNPAILWVSSLLRQEREACCDDIVVASSNQKNNYINALVSFQEYSLENIPYVMAFGIKRNYLLNRVKRIITNENKKLNPFEKAALLAGIFIFSAFTIINEPKDVSGNLGAVIPGEGLTIFKQLSLPKAVPLKKEAKKTVPSQKQVKDTVPAKKERTLQVIITPVERKTELPTIRVTDQDDIKNAIREEANIISAADPEKTKVEDILTQIGAVKDEIQVIKDKIGSPATDERDRARLRNELERKRNELVRLRKELEREKNGGKGLFKRDNNDYGNNLFKSKVSKMEVDSKELNYQLHNDIKVDIQGFRDKLNTQPKAAAAPATIKVLPQSLKGPDPPAPKPI